jgi:transposase
MQGQKEYKEKLFISFRLSEHVPNENFYRRLKETLNLSYLRTLTEAYYGTEGQKSIDTEVFFKFMLIGYLENINSDRQIIEIARLRLDMLYFLGYDLDEPLPWHSTLSRTRKLFGEEVFLELFRNILTMCAQRGIISGKVQAIDSAFIKANASMDSLVEREIQEHSQEFFNQITENEEEKSNKKVKHSERYVSTTDTDARVSRKQGKLPALNHLGIISVDTENHVICGAMADFADTKDSKTTEKIVGQTIENMRQTGLKIEEVLADTGYSSGQSYKYLEAQDIIAYIPTISGYKPEKEGFTYNQKEDCYICSEGIKLPFKRIKTDKGRTTSSREYQSAASDCKNCPLKCKCCKRLNYKRLKHSVDKTYYDKAYKLLNTKKGKSKMKLRGATVEPVWGTLLNFRRLRKVYTKGNDLANKQVLMATAAYNLKKLMSFNRIKSAASAIKNIAVDVKTTVLSQILLLLGSTLVCFNYRTINNGKLTFIVCL